MATMNINIPQSFERWSSLIDMTDLDEIQKQAIKTRIISVVMRLRSRLRRLSVSYTCLRTTTTVGSLLVPSILTLQSPSQLPGTGLVSGFNAYWLIWGIGLIVSISNAFVSLFRVDKNYFTVGHLLEKIESEAWLFLTQSGPYNPEYDQHEEENPRIVVSIGGGSDTVITGHRAKFRKFIEKCEILINKAVRSEYATGFRQGSTNGAASTAGQPAPRLLRNIPDEAVAELYGRQTTEARPDETSPNVTSSVENERRSSSHISRGNRGNDSGGSVPGPSARPGEDSDSTDDDGRSNDQPRRT